jgi:hypothetical protein
MLYGNLLSGPSIVAASGGPSEGEDYYEPPKSIKNTLGSKFSVSFAARRRAGILRPSQSPRWARSSIKLFDTPDWGLLLVENGHLTAETIQRTLSNSLT